MHKRFDGIVLCTYTMQLTFIAVPDCVKVDVVVVLVEEEEGNPGVESVDRHEQQYPHNPSLFRWVAVVAQVLVDLERKKNVFLLDL